MSAASNAWMSASHFEGSGALCPGTRKGTSSSATSTAVETRMAVILSHRPVRCCGCRHSSIQRCVTLVTALRARGSRLAPHRDMTSRTHIGRSWWLSQQQFSASRLHPLSSWHSRPRQPPAPASATGHTTTSAASNHAGATANTIGADAANSHTAVTQHSDDALRAFSWHRDSAGRDTNAPETGTTPRVMTNEVPPPGKIGPPVTMTGWSSASSEWIRTTRPSLTSSTGR